MLHRRLTMIPLLVLVALSLTIAVARAWTYRPRLGPSSAGVNEWHWPTGTEFHGGFLGWMDYNTYYREYHLARDFKAPAGSPVYAIGSGRVVAIRNDMYGSETSRGSAVLVQHRTSSGAIFVGLYGHVTRLRVWEGKKVLAGERLGVLNDFKPSHLHFAIHVGAYEPDDNIWRGYTPATNVTYGFVDPMAYLYGNTPAAEFSASGGPAIAEPSAPALH